MPIPVGISFAKLWRKMSLGGEKLASFCAASLLVTPILTPCNAQSLQLRDLPLHSVVQIGSYDYVKVADNAYMQSSEVTCPDGSTVGGQYVKCFADEDDFDDQCSGVSGNCVDGSSYGAKYDQMCLTCKTGYKYTDTYTDCTLTCGARSSNSNADTCTCTTGYSVNSAHSQTTYTTTNTACNYLICGKYSSQTSGNNLSCTCTSGYTVDSAYKTTAYTSTGGSCSYLKCGANSSQTSGNTASCTCNSGWYTSDGKTSYTTAGGSCNTQTLPCGAHSSNNASNPLQCDCDKGYFYNSSGAMSYTTSGGACNTTTLSMNMNDFTSEMCANFTTPAANSYTLVGTMTDTRNNQSYQIRKYADGACWMANNLKYGGEDRNSSGADKCSGKSSASISSSSNVSANSFTGMTTTTYGACVDPSTQSGAPTNSGYLYDYAAAVQDATAYYGGAYNPGSNWIQGICPGSGQWVLPHGSSCSGSGCFQTLGTTASFWNSSSGWNGVYSGYYYTGSNTWNYVGSFGYYWSSTRTNNNYAYNLTFYASGANPTNDNNRRYTFAVRCLVR